MCHVQVLQYKNTCHIQVLQHRTRVMGGHFMLHRYHGHVAQDSQWTGGVPYTPVWRGGWSSRWSACRGGAGSWLVSGGSRSRAPPGSRSSGSPCCTRAPSVVTRTRQMRLRKQYMGPLWKLKTTHKTVIWESVHERLRENNQMKILLRL